MYFNPVKEWTPSSYEAVGKKSHKNLKVDQCGLFVSEQYPLMGASPDGRVSCKCCGVGLLEVKCSFTYQNVEPLEACKDDHYHLYIDENNDVRLKHTSPWYVQIQGQMGILFRYATNFLIIML